MFLIKKPVYFNSFSLNRKKRVVVRALPKKSKHIYASAADLIHIRIGNLNWCKCRHCKNEAGEIDCPCYREMFIALAKIPGREGSISTFSFDGKLPNY